jgi:hypothetical protein
MKRFSSNSTGISPVTKKTAPTKVNQQKAKEGSNRSSPGLFRESRKTTNNNKTQKKSNYKQQLITNKTYSSAVSSVGPLSLCPKASVRESRNR